MSDTLKREPDPVDIHVGLRIKLARKIAQVAQADLAEAIDVTFQQIQKYESGHNRISASRLVMVCRKLKHPVSFFFEGVDQPGNDANNPLMSNEALSLVQLFYRCDRDDRQIVYKLIEALSRKRLEPLSELAV